MAAFSFPLPGFAGVFVVTVLLQQGWTAITATLALVTL